MPRVLIALLALLAALLGAAADAAADPGVVGARLETPPVYGDEADRNADSDDPAIWVNRRDRRASLVVTTKKEAGLTVFDLDGRLVQDIPAPPTPPGADRPGRFNNVDVARAWGRDLAVVSDRGRDRLRIFAIDGDAAAPLSEVTVADPPRVFSPSEAAVDEQATAYGLTTWNVGRRLYALVSQRSRTAVALVQLTRERGGAVGYERIATVELPASFPVPGGGTWSPCGDPGDLPQVEGMVVDPARSLLYAGQEDVGIWRIALRPWGLGRPELVDRVREFGVPAVFDPVTEECVVSGPDPGIGGAHLSADVEGLTIYPLPFGGGYLLASSQGDDTFAVYAARGSVRYLGSARIELDGDTVQESDGADVTPAWLGGAYPRGLLVTQDGEPSGPAVDPARPDPTNFKFTRWDDFARGFSPPLAVLPR